MVALFYHNINQEKYFEHEINLDKFDNKKNYIILIFIFGITTFSANKKFMIVEVFPDAMAVDMESAALAQICHLYKMPFLSFRVISDIPLKPNNEIDYQNFWSEMADESFGVTKELILSIINK